jgi:hypothetical protein
MNPHILRTWIEWMFVDGRQTTELVIVTDLETRPDAQGFDEEAFNSMVHDALTMFVAGGHERVRVVPEGARDA